MSIEINSSIKLSDLMQNYYKDATTGTPKLHKMINIDGQEVDASEFDVSDKDIVCLSPEFRSDLNALMTSKNSLKPPIELQVQDVRDSYTKTTINGKEYYLYDAEYEKLLNDPSVKITEHGIARHEGDILNGGRIWFLGESVDAPRYEQPKYTADYFNKFNDTGDFLVNAAQDYQTYNKFGINDIPADSGMSANIEKHVKSMLDFFSKGNIAQDDLDRAKLSIENIIKELAEMLWNGEEADLSKVKDKVDIMGEQVSIAQLLEMQKYGKELTDQLINTDKAGMQLTSERVGEFAKHGLIKSMGMSCGDQIGGTLGEMFKSAWGAEVDRYTQIRMNELHSPAVSAGNEQYNSFVKTLNNGAEWMYDVFSRIDTSSKENALKSFKDLSGEIDKAIRKFLDQYTGTGGLAEKMRADVDSYFNDLMGFKSVNIRA